MLGGSSQPFNQSVCIGWSAADYTTQMRLKFMLPPEPSEGEGRELKCDFFLQRHSLWKTNPLKIQCCWICFSWNKNFYWKRTKKKSYVVGKWMQIAITTLWTQRNKYIVSLNVHIQHSSCSAGNSQHRWMLNLVWKTPANRIMATTWPHVSKYLNISYCMILSDYKEEACCLG